jgi:valyl-tRNA synthetase
VDVEAERERLEKELEEAEGQIKRLEKLLASPFADKAPPEVVQKERDKLEDYRETAEKIKQQLG